MASSRESARWALITSRQSSRRSSWPAAAAAFWPIAHCAARSFLPPIRPAPSDSTPTPWVPAQTMPDGEVVLATAIGSDPLTGSICSRASWSSNQSLVCETTSPASRRTITPRASSMRGRWVTGSMPIITASEISAPGPTPSIARPFVR